MTSGCEHGNIELYANGDCAICKRAYVRDYYRRNKRKINDRVVRRALKESAEAGINPELRRKIEDREMLRELGLGVNELT